MAHGQAGQQRVGVVTCSCFSTLDRAQGATTLFLGHKSLYVLPSPNSGSAPFLKNEEA